MVFVSRVGYFVFFFFSLDDLALDDLLLTLGVDIETVVSYEIDMTDSKLLTLTVK